MRIALATAGVLLASACGGETSVLAVVNTDFEVPSELALVRVIVQGDTLNDFVLDGAPPLSVPFSFAIVPLDAEDAPLKLQVQAFDTDRSSRFAFEVETAFRAGRIVRLPLNVDRRCETESCSATLPAETLEEVEPGREI